MQEISESKVNMLRLAIRLKNYGVDFHFNQEAISFMTQQGRIAFNDVQFQILNDFLSDRQFVVVYGKLANITNASCFLAIDLNGEDYNISAFGFKNEYLKGDLYAHVNGDEVFGFVYENSLEQFFNYIRNDDGYMPMKNAYFYNFKTGESDGYYTVNDRAVSLWEQASEETINQTADQLALECEGERLRLTAKKIKAKRKELEREENRER